MNKSATHLSFNVSNIEKTTDFYTNLLKKGPSKVKRNYVKFELDDPAMVLSFIQSQNEGEFNWSSSGAHFGIRVNSSQEVEERFKDLRASGIPLLSERDVECCYALQDKFWANDPDGIRWDVYALIPDADHLKKSNDGKNPECCTVDSVRASHRATNR